MAASARFEDGVARNVLGVVIPTIQLQPVCAGMRSLPRHLANLDGRRSLYFATRRTVATRCYPLEIAKRLPGSIVVQQACPI